MGSVIGRLRPGETGELRTRILMYHFIFFLTIQGCSVTERFRVSVSLFLFRLYQP